MPKGYDFRSSYRWKKKVRPAILRRDRYTCQWQFERICRGIGDTVDHVIAVADGDCVSGTFPDWQEVDLIRHLFVSPFSTCWSIAYERSDI